VRLNIVILDTLYYRHFRYASKKFIIFKYRHFRYIITSFQIHYYVISDTLFFWNYYHRLFSSRFFLLNYI